MARHGQGTCTECGAENVRITVIDDETLLCDACLDELDYMECEECHEFWRTDAVDFIELDDGRMVCEYCAEDLNTEDDE